MSAPAGHDAVIRRRFFDRPGRQIHYREIEGTGTPLVLLHLLPGSAKQMEPLMRDLAPRRCIAPDLAGTGDSDPLPLSDPGIADYADDLAAFLAQIADGAPVDLYGTHTGAGVAIELALAAPHLVRRVVLEGIPMFTPEQAATYTEHYAPEIAPDLNGGHLLWAHNFCRDQVLFYPWYDKSPAAARGGGLPPAADLHAWVLEVIKGLPGIPRAYRAAFAYPAAERLAGLTQPVLCLAPEGDSLFEATRQAIAHIPRGTLVVLKGNENDRQGASALAQFLESAEGAV